MPKRNPHIPCPECGNLMRYTSKVCKVCAGRAKLPPDEKRARRNERLKRYGAAHKEETQARNRAYYLAHAEELKARQREVNKANSETINAKLKTKRAADPEHFKEINHKYDEQNRSGRISYQQWYRVAHKERVRQTRLNYYRSEKGKAIFMAARKRHQDSPFLKENKYHLLWVENRPCEVCGSYSQREVDHVVMRSQGGSDDRSNLRVLCFAHHRKAGSGRHSTVRD